MLFTPRGLRVNKIAALLMRERECKKNWQRRSKGKHRHPLALLIFVGVSCGEPKSFEGRSNA